MISVVTQPRIGTYPLRKSGLVAIAAIAFIAGCAPGRPTPYQPLANGGGYEEARLQENMYRVSFKGNRFTAETAVLDYIYLRCAELTLDAGYTHFFISQSFGKINIRSAPRPHISAETGIHHGDGFWGHHGMTGFGPAYERDYWVDSHLAIFVIRMGNEQDGARDNGMMDAKYLARSLAGLKIQHPARVP